MAGGNDVPLFGDRRGECCARIEQVWAPVKIVLITKDDPYLIERWIAHHIKIVGAEGLLIFDNMSDDPQVHSVYEKYRDRVNIMRFADKYMNVHHSRAYSDLYGALARSSDYCIFLDTDEFLILIDNDRYYDNDRILSFVMSNSGCDLFPSTWLMNENWIDSQFSSTDAGQLPQLLACGKPLIRSSKFPPGYVNHNFQLGARLFAPPFKANLFLLHLTHLYPRQRISANVNKLITLGVVQPGESAESIAARDDIADVVAALYAKEIGDCLALDGKINLVNRVLRPGSLELLPDGTISYYSDAERKALNAFISDPEPIYNLFPDHYRLRSVVDG
jgi:Glycosyl transferase family 2